MKISHLLKINKRKQKELSEYIGVSTDSIRGYENGTHQPPLNVCIKMAEFLNCSLETLAGLDNKNIVDKSMLSKEKQKLIDEILNLQPEKADAVLAFIKVINQKD